MAASVSEVGVAVVSVTVVGCGSGWLAVPRRRARHGLVSSDRSAVAKRVDFGQVWCSLAEGAVGSVLVVVDDVVIEAPFELAVVADQGPVEQFASYGVHPSFCAAVRDRHAYL